VNWVNKGSCFWCGATDDLDEEEIGYTRVHVCGASKCNKELRSAQRTDQDERREAAAEDNYMRY
jgi:hypothetical protein